jgi:WD40 repeat protein
VLSNSNFALASGKTIRILNGKTGSLVRTIVDNSADVLSIAELPNGLLASSGEQKKIKIWNVTNGNLIKTLDLYYSKLTFTANLLVSLKNGVLACVYGDKMIRIWDTNIYKLTRNEIFQDGYSTIALKNGFLASSDDRSLFIWNPYNGLTVKTLFNDGYVDSLVELQNGDLAYSTKDKFGKLEIKIWNINNGRVRTLDRPTKAVIKFIVLRNGLLVSASYDSTMRIWNPENGNLIKTISIDKSFNNGFSLALLDNGDLVSTSLNDIDIWNTQMAVLKQNLAQSGLGINSLAVLTNGYLASANNDGTIKIWNTTSETLVNTINEGSADVWCLAVLPSGDLASGNVDGLIRIWNADTGVLASTLGGHTTEVISLAALNNGYLASGDATGEIKIWNWESESLVMRLTLHTGAIRSLAVLTSGFLASSSDDATIKIWNMDDGSLVRSLTDDSNVIALVELKNGNLASGNHNNAVKIWNVNNGSVVLSLNENSKGAFSLSVLSNGYLASGSRDGEICIWNPYNGILITKLSNHTNNIMSMAVLQNGNLASCSIGGIKIWEIYDQM